LVPELLAPVCLFFCLVFLTGRDQGLGLFAVLIAWSLFRWGERLADRWRHPRVSGRFLHRTGWALLILVSLRLTFAVALRVLSSTDLLARDAGLF
jgi:hypothetical protein